MAAPRAVAESLLERTSPPPTRASLFADRLNEQAFTRPHHHAYGSRLAGSCPLSRRVTSLGRAQRGQLAGKCVGFLASVHEQHLDRSSQDGVAREVARELVLGPDEVAAHQLSRLCGRALHRMSGLRPTPWIELPSGSLGPTDARLAQRRRASTAAVLMSSWTRRYPRAPRPRRTQCSDGRRTGR